MLTVNRLSQWVWLRIKLGSLNASLKFVFVLFSEAKNVTNNLDLYI